MRIAALSFLVAIESLTKGVDGSNGLGNPSPIQGSRSHLYQQQNVGGGYSVNPISAAAEVLDSAIEQEGGTEKENFLPPLPEGWIEVIDPSSGRPYYYHEETRVTTWERPIISSKTDDGNLEGGNIPQTEETKSIEQREHCEDVESEKIVHEDSVTSEATQSVIQEEHMSESHSEQTKLTDINPAPISGEQIETNSGVGGFVADTGALEYDARSEQSNNLPASTNKEDQYDARLEQYNVLPASTNKENQGMDQENQRYDAQGKVNEFGQSYDETHQRWGLPPNQGQQYRPIQSQSIPYQPEMREQPINQIKADTRDQPNPQPYQQSPQQHVNQGIRVNPYFSQPPRPDQETPVQQSKEELKVQKTGIWGRLVAGKDTASKVKNPSLPQAPFRESSPEQPPPLFGQASQHASPPRQNPSESEQKRSESGSDNNYLPQLPPRDYAGLQRNPIQRSSPPPQREPYSQQQKNNYQGQGGQSFYSEQQSPFRPRNQPPPTQYAGQYNGQYGDQYRNSAPYGQPHPSQQGGPTNQNIETSNTVKDAIGNAWKGVLGLGNKTMAVATQAKNNVAHGANQVGQTVGSTSAGVWDKAKGTVGSMGKSMFEEEDNSEKNQQNAYSLSGYGGQPPYSRQQTPPPQYPPQNYGGYPQGSNPPIPRENPPYPHQGLQTPFREGEEKQLSPGQLRSPPLQSTWRNHQQLQNQGQREAEAQGLPNVGSAPISPGQESPGQKFPGYGFPGHGPPGQGPPGHGPSTQGLPAQELSGQESSVQGKESLGQGYQGQAPPVGQASTGQGLPSQGLPGQGLPDQESSGQASLRQGFPGQRPLGQRFPGQGSPGQGPPVQGFPGQGPPGQGYPGQGPPGQGSPGQGPPVQGFPGQGPSGQTYPVQGPPGQGPSGQGYTGQGPPGQRYSDQGPPGQGPSPGR